MTQNSNASASKACPVVYLLEDIDSQHLGQIDLNSLIVSLKPKVSLFLEQNGIPYSLLENYYQEKKIRADEEEYFHEQIGWFKSFDDFIKHHIEECKRLDINLASMHYNRLKYLVDSVVLRVRIITEFIKKISPSSIVYFRREASSDGEPSIYNIWRQDRTTYFEILSLLQKQSFPKLSLKKINLVQAAVNKSKNTSLSGSANLKSMVKHWINFFKYQKIKKILSPQKTYSGTSFLFLDAGTPTIDMILKQVISKGAHVYLKNREVIYRLDSFSEKTETNDDNGKDSQTLKIKQTFEKMEQKIGDPLSNWINEKCSLDVRSLLFPYLRTFITQECPKVLSEIKKFMSFYRTHHINYVVARASAGENYPAPLLAAKAAGITRVCFQHGVDFTDRWDWVMDELGFFDINFAMESSSCDYFKSQTKIVPDNTCEVLESSHGLREIKKKYREGNLKTLKSSKKTPRVFYVPIKLPHGLIKLNSVVCPMTWYFEHQKELLKSFAQKQDFNFVYKHGPYQQWAKESVLPWLKMQNFKNVSIESKVFSRYLDKADRVILDGPTTVLFEAAAAGIPVLNLYHEAMEPADPMAQVFGKCLERFKTSEEALQKIERFLNADPNDYIVNLRLSETDGIEYLKQANADKSQSKANYPVYA